LIGPPLLSSGFGHTQAADYGQYTAFPQYKHTNTGR